MSRLRYNNALGALGATLSSGGTTITFQVAPAFATLSGLDYIPLVLEPPIGAAPSAGFEIVHLTAYTATQLTGTIARAQEGTSATTHASGSLWECSAVSADVDGSVLVVQGTDGTNLGATQTLDFQGGAIREIWLVGTLNADLVATIANRAKGCRFKPQLTQDATGSRAFTLSDGTNTQAITIATSPGALTVIEGTCTDAVKINAAVVGGSGMANPMTASGDVIYGTTAGAPARLAKGTDGQVLTLASGLPSWAAPTGGGGVTSIFGGTPTSTFTTGISGGTP